jgi:tetratricopeptide (TPR) repeat protein
MRYFLSLTVIACIFLCHSVFAQKPSPQVQAEIVKIMNEGAVKQNRGDFQGALANYTKALQMSPKDVQILVMRARLLAFGLGNVRAAIDDATKALELSPKLGDMYFVRGASYLNTQRLPEAEKDLELAVQYKPTNVSEFAYRYKILGITYAVQQKYQQAIDVFTKGIKLAPKEGSLYYERANSLSYLKRYREAIPDYDIALKYDSTNVNAYVNRASTRTAIQDYEGAVKDYSVLIGKFPTNTLYWINRGITHSEMQKFDNAIADLTKTLELDSMYHRARIFRARTYMEMNNLSAALEDCNSILRLNPQDAIGFTNAGNSVSAYLQRENFINADVYAIRSRVRLLMGDADGCCSDAQKAIDLGSENGYKLNIIFCEQRIFLPAPDFPVSHQLYARDANDSATVPVKASFRARGFDSAIVVLKKNGLVIQRTAQYLRYLNVMMPGATAATMQAAIDTSVRIHAGLEAYSIHLSVKNAQQDSLLTERTNIVCGDVLLVSGQSNAILGEQASYTTQQRYIRTFTQTEQDSYWGIATANAKNSYNIGAMAYQAATDIVTTQKIPIAVINGGLSGSTIEQHFRDNANPLNIRSWYGRMLWRTKTSGLANVAKVMVWYQGESNANAGYGDKFTTLWNGWKLDYPNLKKTYLVQIRPSECNQSPIDSPREEQRLLVNRMKDVVEILASAGLPVHDGCHYANEGYITLGKQLARLVQRDFYRTTDTIGISSPNLLNARWTNAKRDEIMLEFSTNDSLVCGADTLVGGRMRSLATDAFLLDGRHTKAVSVRSTKNTVLVKLTAPSTATSISYVPEKCYVSAPEVPCTVNNVYEGPWLTTRRGVGALTFTQVRIQANP